jgi:hypothetical protein
LNIDLVRGLTAHLTAAVAIIGGGGSLVVMTASGTVAPEVGVPAIVAIVSAAAGFLFGAETAKQAAKQAKSDLESAPPSKP